MELQELMDGTAAELIGRIQASKGLGVFAKRRAKFEGWLKVELIDILLKNGIQNVVPEAGLVDVSFGNVAIELKTVNTNYRDGIADDLIRPITMNVKDIIEDIRHHRGVKSEKFAFKYIVFIVFPLGEEQRGWQAHLNKIQDALCNECRPHFFKFGGSHISGCLYFGEVGDLPVWDTVV